jgi:hypothetical protein
MRVKKAGVALIKTGRIRDGAVRNPFSRFYYSASRNTVLRCNMMMKAGNQPISAPCDAPSRCTM